MAAPYIHFNEISVSGRSILIEKYSNIHPLFALIWLIKHRHLLNYHYA